MLDVLERLLITVCLVDLISRGLVESATDPEATPVYIILVFLVA